MQYTKPIDLMSALIVAVLVLLAIAMEYVLELSPCILCNLQRIIFVPISLIFLASAYTKQPSKIYTTLHSLGIILAIFGLSIAIRQIYLQFNPDPFATCGISLSYIVKNFPLGEIMEHVLNGSGDCQKNQWEIFGISLPMWSALAFLACAIVNIVQIKRQKH